MAMASFRVVGKALDEAGAAMDGRYHVTPRKRAALTQYLYRVAGKPIRGSSLLDVGCGHGIDCISAAMLGASRVVGIDVDEVGINHMQGVLNELDRRGYELNVRPLLHDVADGIPCDDNSFDVVFLIEAVSHILQLKAVLQEVLRATKPGGAVIINDSNNVLARGKAEQTIDLWERWENGPRPGADALPQEERSYRAMRQHIIQERYPSLTQDDLEELSLATTGKTRAQVLDVVDDYLETGQIPNRRYRHGTCPVSPDGCYMERLFDPYELASTLEEVGFSRTTVMAHLTHGNSTRALIDRLFRVLPASIAMYLSRGFIIVARK